MPCRQIISPITGKEVESKTWSDLYKLTGQNEQEADRLYEQLLSSGFISWFGNWLEPDENTSKVVNEHGEPLVVYHGSNYKFEEFNRKYFGSGDGRAKYGDGFYFTSEYNRAYGYRGVDPWIPEEQAKKMLENMDPQVYPVFLNIKDSDSDSFQVNDEYVVQSSNQIKSVFNKGTFSSESRVIYDDVSSNTSNNYHKQVMRAVNRFGLKPKTSYNERGYTTKNDRISESLIRRMNEWFDSGNPDAYNKIKVLWNKTYNIIQFTNKSYSGLVDDVSAGPGTEKLPFKYVGPFMIRPDYYKRGTYKEELTGKLYNVEPQGLFLFDSYLEFTGMTKEEFAKKYIPASEARLSFVRSFLTNEEPMYIYNIVEVKKQEDVIPEFEDERFLQLYQNRLNIIKELKRQLKVEKEPKERQIIKDKIKRLEEQIASLKSEDSATIATIMNLMESDLEAASKILETNPSKRNLDYARSLLTNYIDILTIGFKAEIDVLDTESKSKIIDFISRARAIGIDINKKYMSLAADKVKRMTGVNVLNIDGLPVDSQDVGALSKELLDSVANPNPIVQTLTKNIKNAISKLGIRFAGFERQNKDIVKNLRNFYKGKKVDNIYDFMLQETPEGKKSGNFVSRYSHDYEVLKNSAMGDSDIGVRMKFWADNHTFNIDDKTWKQRRDVRIEYFKSHYAETVALTEKDMKLGINYETKLQAKAEEYADMLNPHEFVRIMQKARTKFLHITRTEKKFYYNFIRFGGLHNEKIGEEWVPVIETVADTKFFDPKWIEIQKMSKDDPRKVFYNHFTSNVRRGRSMISDEEIKLPWNFIPEKLSTTGVGGKLNNWVLDNISQRLPKDGKTINPITGEVDKKIPVYMLNGEIAPENKSYDLGNVLESFMREMIAYEEKKLIEEDSQLLLFLLKNQKVYETNADGTIKRDKDGNKVYKDKESFNLQSAEYRIDANIYEQRQKIELISPVKFYDSITKKEMKTLEKEMGDIELTKEEKEEVLSYISSDTPYIGSNEKIIDYINKAFKYKQLVGKGRHVTGNKVVNLGMFYTSLKFLGVNIFVGLAELLQGVTSLLTESASGKFFSDKDAFKALGRVVTAVVPWDTPHKKLLQNRSRFFSARGQAFQESEQNNIVSKIAFAQYNAANFISNNSFLEAMLLKEKIKDNKGVEHSLSDVLHIDDYMNLSLKGDFDQSWLYDTDSSGKRVVSQNVIDLMHKFREILKSNRERQSFEDPIPLEKTSVGRVLGQFKKNWMFSAYYTRFGKHREADLFLGTEREGFYRSFGRLWLPPKRINDFTGEEEYDTSVEGLMQVPKNLLKAWWKFTFLGRRSIKEGEFSELDKANLHKFMREMTFITTLSAFLLIFSSLGDDDDDRNNKRTYFINQLARLQRDLTTYMSPESFASILRNPAPLMSSVIDILKITDSVVASTVLMDPFIDSGKNEGRLRIGVALEKVTPAVNQIEKLRAKFEREVVYTAY